MPALQVTTENAQVVNSAFRILLVMTTAHIFVAPAGLMQLLVASSHARVDRQLSVPLETHAFHQHLVTSLTLFSVGQRLKMLQLRVLFLAHGVIATNVQAAKAVLHTHSVMKLGKVDKQHQHLPQFPMYLLIPFIVVLVLTMRPQLVDILVLVVSPQIVPVTCFALQEHHATPLDPFSAGRAGKMLPQLVTCHVQVDSILIALLGSCVLVIPHV